VIFCEIASRIPGAGVRPAIEVAFGVDLTHALLSISNGDAINQIIPRKKNIGQIILFISVTGTCSDLGSLIVRMNS